MPVNGRKIKTHVENSVHDEKQETFPTLFGKKVIVNKPRRHS